MTMGRFLLIFIVILGTAAHAVEPDEVLDDPVLETRARELSQGLRCLVCRNESIDESNAELARDLRVLVRERLVAGDSDSEAIDFIVARYGEYVLLEPTGRGANIVLWAAGPLMLILAALILAIYYRPRRDAPEDSAPLTAIEREKLDQILKD